MKQITLTKGKFAMVDDDDFNRVNQFKWCAFGKDEEHLYSMRIDTRNGGRKCTLMHRFIMGALDDPSIFIDHKNENGLDNRTGNLRKCTRSQNGMNRGSQANNKSGQKGVLYCNEYKTGRRWKARITVKQKLIYIGGFFTFEEAQKAYIEAAKKHHGEFYHE